MTTQTLTASKGPSLVRNGPQACHSADVKARWLSTSSRLLFDVSGCASGFEAGGQSYRRGRSLQEEGQVQQLCLNLSLPASYSSPSFPPRAPKCITLQGQVRLPLPNGKGWFCMTYIICSLPLSSGLSNGHEGAYNEILSNMILLSASPSTLQPWAQTPVGARALAAPASPSGPSAGDLPSCGIWDCPCEHIGTDRADTDDFLNLCESPCAASSNSSFL